MSKEQFLSALSEADDTPFQPTAYYDRDGDCIEFIAAQEPFYADRKDCLLTVYYGVESGKIVGTLIKRIKRVLAQYPGFQIDVRDGRTRMVHIIRAAAWQDGDPEMVCVYNELIFLADTSLAEVALEEMCA